jgi:hypothetical protein
MATKKPAMKRMPIHFPAVMNGGMKYDRRKAERMVRR